MKKIIAAVFIFAGLSLAQTSVTVTVTVPTAAVPVLDAWRKTQCATTDAKGACLSLKWDTLKAMVIGLLGDTVNSTLLTALSWAIETNDASLPASVKTAIATKATADVTINTTKSTTVAVQ